MSHPGTQIRKLLLHLLLLQSTFCLSQDYEWWNVKHNWDGVTPWRRYIILSPAYLGPNALPVPDIKDGALTPGAHFEFSLERHFSNGDKTENLYTKLFIPLFSDRVGLNSWIVPLEHYKMDTLTRDIRRARDFDGEGFSGGDFYIGTYIQLVKGHKHIPDILITLNMKTASGTQLAAARFTDSPGYFLDMSVGKEIPVNRAVLKSLRPYVMIGFYSWQVTDKDIQQDDALLYGAGLNMLFSKMELINSWGGYRGFLNNGDRPMVYRVILQTKRQEKVNYKLMFQRGLNDFSYTTLSIGCRFILPDFLAAPK